MKKNAAQSGIPALELIEEAVHLLRTAPPRVLLAYYTGAIPFALGLLFFWTDMSCGAFARQRCPASALGMALLFLWLKCWQAVFASGLRDRLAAATESNWGWRRVGRLLAVQCILQPTRLFALPMAFVAAIPFPWVLAFYENFTVLGDGADDSVRAAAGRATAQARLWPKQNHVALALLALVAAVVWVNALIAVYTLPHFLKMFLGIETAFTRAGGWVIFNSTFQAVILTLTWLACDPLLKAVYVLRCFHGEARKDGADLLAELSRVRAGAKSAAVAALLLLSCLGASAGAAAGTNPPPAAIAPAPAADLNQSGSVPASQIDDAIKETLQHDKYAWRLPRQRDDMDDSPTQAWLRSFFSSIGRTFARWAHSVENMIQKIFDWFEKHFGSKPKAGEEGPSGQFDWGGLLRWFAYALLAFALAVLALLAARVWRQGWRRPRVVAAEIVPARPDLNDENITAAQMPEDGWLKLAADLLQQGNLRLALRAYYLASLAHLAAREIVSLARFKSNHDYEREVHRRARGAPELRAAFSANVRSFDSAWYGLHEVTAGALAEFQANFQRIRSC